jgi:hypothetical protein
MLAMLAGVAAAAADPPQRPFDAATWQRLLQRRDAPRIVLFTTSDCEYCAAEFARLRSELRTQPGVAPWFAVVALDGRDSAAALAAAGVFAGCDVLYYVTGDAPALRYRVSPRWRGETPYVVMLRTDGARRDALGASPPGASRWLRGSQRGPD